MTGFSRVQSESELGTLSIELRAVNSRYLDVFFKIPESIKPFENSLRQSLAKRLSRGKVECAVRFYASVADKTSVDLAYVNTLMAISNQLAEKNNIKNIGVGELFNLPGVLIEKPAGLETLKGWFMPLFKQAVDELVEHRQSEGKHLQALISQRLQSVGETVDDATKNYAKSSKKVRAKLYEKLSNLAEGYQSQVDEVRFEQEIIYLMQKMDIAEETDRLNGHIFEVRKLLNVDVPTGRKLDFLMQEMNRESNTIASKSQYLGLTMNAVELKVLLEQMREQIQNIE